MAKKQHLSAKEVRAARTALMSDWEVLASAFQNLPSAEKRSAQKCVAAFYKSPTRAQASRYLQRLDTRDLKFLCRFQRTLYKRAAA